MSGARLLLVNHYETALELTFPWARGPRQPNTQCRVKAAGVLDLSTVHGFTELPKAQVKSIVEGSPDYQHFKSRFWVDLVDESDLPKLDERRIADRKNGFRFLPEPVAPSTEEAPPAGGDPSLEVPSEKIIPYPGTAATTIEDVKRRAAEEKVQAEAIQRAREHKVEFAAEGKEAPESQTQTVGLDPGVREALADSVPSSKWPVERLREYADARGIDTKGLSRSAILRKIRGS